MFGLSLEKLLLVAFVAAVVIGPQRLPAYAHRLAEIVRALRAFVESTRAELAPDLDLDPRRYDPRRIVREALETPAAGGSAEVRSRTSRRSGP